MEKIKLSDIKIDLDVFAQAPKKGIKKIIDELKSYYDVSCKDLNNRLERTYEKIHYLYLKDSFKVVLIEKRVKSLETLVEKTWREKWRRPFRECKDLLGIRIITLLDKDVQEIQKIIENIPESEITRNYHTQDESGYRAVHIIIKPEKIMIIKDSIGGIPCEVQIRSVVQHCIDVFSHAVYYKSGLCLPKDLLNSQSRDLFAMFRVIDELFVHKYTKLNEIEKKAEVRMKLNRTNFEQSVKTFLNNVEVHLGNKDEVAKILRKFQKRGYETVGDLIYLVDVRHLRWPKDGKLFLDIFLKRLYELFEKRAK